MMGENIRARRAGDDTTGLLDFLKNHPPPPDNYMSKPDKGEQEDPRGRWSKLKRLRKRGRSLPRQPQQIQLPDSAVAGMTIGGHRHIAISIPREAAPFGKEMRSQYPVFTHDMHTSTPCKKSVRSLTKGKRVVPALRPSRTKVREPDQGPKALKRRSPPYANSQGLWPPPLPPHKPTGNPGSQPHDYIGVLTTSFDTSLLDDSSAPWYTPQSPSREEGQAQSRQSQRPFPRAVFPARASSLGAARAIKGKDPLAMNCLIQYQELISSVPLVSRGRCFANSHNDERRATAASYNEAGGEGSKSQQMANSAIMSCPQDNGPPPGRHGSQTRSSTLRLDKTVLSRDHDSCVPTPGSTPSRKTTVREKKRRDIETIWYAKLMGQQERRKTDCEEARQSLYTNASLQAERDTKSAIAKSDSALTMSDIMVVMDLKPISRGGFTPSRDPETTASGSEKSGSKRRAAATSVPKKSANEPSIPTPPTSAHGSPPQRRSASTRASLTHPWKAIRKQERKAREALTAAPAKAEQVVSGGIRCENVAAQQADQEEQRLRDMESRLRRLERKGSVWLQALVPVLDNMNRTVADYLLEDIRDWRLDGEAPCASYMHEKKPRRSSMSSGGMLEKYVKHKYSDEASSDSFSRSEATSGFENH